MKVTSSSQRPGLLGLGATVLFLVSVGAISFRSFLILRQSDVWIGHTHEVIDNLNGLLAATETAESKCHGFILTGQPVYLDAYRASLIRAMQAQSTAEELTADNPEAQRRLRTLQSLAAQQTRDEEILIHLRQHDGSRVAAWALQGDPGGRLRWLFEEQVRGLQDEELQLLTLRRERAKRVLQQDGILLSLGMILGLIVAVAAAWSARWLNLVRRQTKETLRDSDENYRMLLDGVRGHAIFMLDLQGRVVTWNAGAEQQTGYRANEIMGRNFYCFFPAEEIRRGRAEGVLQATAAIGRHEEQSVSVRKDGSQFPVHITLTALRDLSGSLRGYSVVSSDMSETEESRAKYRGLLEAASDALVVVAETGEIVLLNSLAEKQFGYPPNELLGQKVTNIIPRGFVEQLVADRTRSTEDTPVAQIGMGRELSGCRKDGSEFPIEMMLSPLASPEGILVTAAIRDISERRIAQEALLEGEERFRTMANNISQLAWMADEKGAIFWYNKRWFDYTGTTLEEMMSSGWQRVHHPDHAKRVAEKITRCFERGETWEDTFPLRGRDGNYRWFLSGAVCVRDGEGKVLRWFGTNTDVSDSRRMEEELLKEKERAQDAREAEARLQANLLEQAREAKARLQENFLSHVSHELRTPLTAIYFFTTNLLDGVVGDLTAEQHQQLELALNNIRQLKDMVSDLIDISRIEKHKITLAPEPVSPAKLLAGALSTCRTNAVARNITLLSDIAEGIPFIWADASRVRQILINLIDNGIKFTPSGGTVTVGSGSFVEGDGFLCLSVSDTGSGIRPEHLEIIFDRLAQIEDGTGGSRSGLGLGLFITRELVSLQGGRIWVESVPGKGSVFSFTLPLFSLSKLCARIFTATNLGAGYVTLIAVDVNAVDGAVQGDIQAEIRRILSLSIHPARDLLLPRMSDTAPSTTYFIVACADSTGSELIVNRISGELQKFDSAAKLQPVISATTLAVAPGSSGSEQISDVTGRIEQFIQAHLATGPAVGSLFPPKPDPGGPAWPLSGRSEGKPISSLVN